MYVNPILAGVIATVLFEAVVLVVWGIWLRRRR